ncbi:MAG: ABC transporter permease subunit [Candidatus Atribacteria bacterium]|nr:ABC transporter permease subunit [Candidatus Atribacteria bacterium]
MAVWMIMGVIQKVPREVEEAARIDGCGYLSTLFRVVVPLSVSGIAVAAILGYLNNF